MNTDYIPSVSWTRTTSHMLVGKHVDDVAAGPTDVPTYRYIAPAFFDPMIYEQTYNHVLCGDQNFLFNLNRIWL